MPTDGHEEDRGKERWWKHLVSLLSIHLIQISRTAQSGISPIHMDSISTFSTNQRTAGEAMKEDVDFLANFYNLLVCILAMAAEEVNEAAKYH